VSAALAGTAVELAWQVLDAVADPEIPVVSIRELGILRHVFAHADGTLEVVITPTYSGCPAMGQIEDEVRAALTAAGLEARITTRLAPAWTTDWMSPSARDKLRAYGIAPPHTVGDDSPKPIRFAPKKIAHHADFAGVAGLSDSSAVACPRCGSFNTTETSHFGSTACKALYKCLGCLEPFDYFKSY